MSIKSLPKDIVNILLGLVQENVKKEVKSKSVVYQLVNINKNTAFTISYYSRDLNKIKEKINKSKNSLDYLSYHINPDIESDGVYVFKRSGEMVKITNDKEEAEVFSKKYGFDDLPLDRYFNIYDHEQDYGY